MNNQEIIEIQNKILDFSPNRLGTDLKFCCSEISRLIIKWFSNFDKSYKFYILKGINAMGSEIAHDILVVNKDSTFMIIDPTIWQFFPNAKTIVIYKGNNLEEGIDKIKQKYNCNWTLGLQEKIPNSRMEREYLKIIYSIVEENLKD